MKLKDFLTSQAAKAGVVLEGIDFPDFDVPDTVAKGIDNSLISIVDAKNNHPEIKNHYHKQNLDTIDKLLKAAEGRIPELAEDDEWKGEKSTFKRVEMLDSKISSILAKKTGDPSKKNELQAQIDALHAQLKAANDGRIADKTAFENQMVSFKTQTAINQLLTGQKTIHDSLPSGTRSAILETLINQELQDNGVKFAFDDSGKLTLLKSDGSNFYGENHQQIAPQAFIEQSLAKHKQLQVSTAPTGATGQQQDGKIIDAGSKNPNASLIAANQQVIQNLEKNGVVAR